MIQTPRGVPSGVEWPRNPIGMPSLSQHVFVRHAFQWALAQSCPNLEYVVIDGGSTDGSLELFREHADRLAYWVSKPDRGRNEAINESFPHNK